MPGKSETEIDLDDLLLGPDDELPSEQRREAQKQAKSLRPLPSHFVRVPVPWICQKRKGRYLYPPQWRLFHYALYRSHWGQCGVAITGAFRAEIAVSRNKAYDAVEKFERGGWFRVERLPGHALVVWPLVLTG
jgi:hypothetical protein